MVRVPTINTESTVYLSAPFTTIALATLPEFLVIDLEGVVGFIRAEQPFIGVFFADTPIEYRKIYLPKGLYAIRMVNLSRAMFINAEAEKIASVPVSVRSVPTFIKEPEVAISMETHSPHVVKVNFVLFAFEVLLVWPQ